jgi:hypothetical protein
MYGCSDIEVGPKASIQETGNGKTSSRALSIFFAVEVQYQSEIISFGCSSHNYVLTPLLPLPSFVMSMKLNL